MLRLPIQRNISLFQRTVSVVRKITLVSSSNNNFFNGIRVTRILPLAMVQYVKNCLTYFFLEFLIYAFFLGSS
jgi:hypothetical protein